MSTVSDCDNLAYWLWPWLCCLKMVLIFLRPRSVPTLPKVAKDIESNCPAPNCAKISDPSLSHLELIVFCGSGTWL